MAVTRRGFILAAGLAPLVQAAAAATKKIDSAVAAAAPSLRPPARATSALVCARCGADDHATLDPRCPADLEAQAALQSAARRAVGATRGDGA